MPTVPALPAMPHPRRPVPQPPPATAALTHDLHLQRIGYDAALHHTTRILQPSLTDFLR